MALADTPALSVLQFSHQETRKLRWDESYGEPICPMMWPVLCLTCSTPRVVSGKPWISRMLVSRGTLAGMGLWGCLGILVELMGPLIWAQA